jgi:nitrogen regulatory protein PII
MKGTAMYWVVAVISVRILDVLRERFAREGIVRFTAAEVEVFEPDSDAATGKHAMRIEVAVNEEFLEPTLKVLEKLGSEGHDVSVHVGSIADARRIRTGESGPEAI